MILTKEEIEYIKTALYCLSNEWNLDEEDIKIEKEIFTKLEELEKNL